MKLKRACAVKEMREKKEEKVVNAKKEGIRRARAARTHPKWLALAQETRQLFLVVYGCFTGNTAKYRSESMFPSGEPLDLTGSVKVGIEGAPEGPERVIGPVRWNGRLFGSGNWTSTGREMARDIRRMSRPYHPLPPKDRWSDVDCIFSRIKGFLLARYADERLPSGENKRLANLEQNLHDSD